MSLKLRELIKKVRSCKTAEEERSLVNKEMAEIRNMSRELSDQLKSRNLAKCIFIHMLGHQTNFIQMTCVNLLSSQKFSEKRIAYIALCVLLDERSEVLLLTANTIKKDLENSNQFIVAIALNSIGEACTGDMCRQLSGEIVKLMKSPNPFIKKKAALACSKIVRKCPDLTESFIDKIHTYFEDKNHGVLLCGASLAIQVIKAEPQLIEKFRKYLPTIIKYLRNLVSTNYAPEYDINGISDPFLQVKLLELLQQFGRGNSEASEEMNDLLASISTNTETNKNTGNAVLYELVRCIINIEANTGLISLSSTILGRFLSHKDNNYKYIALNTLQSVAKTDLNSVQKHKNIILECMKDNDISIKRRALDLVYIIINTNNIKQIIKECLNFLIVAEPEIKFELTTKLTQSLEKYSPSLKWQIDTAIKMLCLAGNYVSDETVSSIINLIVSITELHLYTVHKLFLSVKNNLAQEGLVKVALYIFGEFGDILISNSVQGPENEPITVSEEDLIQVLKEIQNRKYSNSIVKEYLLNCNIKLSIKVSQSSKESIKHMIENENCSFHTEVQQRANEYLVFMGLNDNELKSQILNSIPTSKIAKESEIKKYITALLREIVLEEYENYETEDIKLSSNKSLIKREKTVPQKQTSTSDNSKKGPEVLIDLNNIFSTSLIVNQPAKNQAKTDINSLDSIFNSINFSNTQLPQVNDQQQPNQLNNMFAGINLTSQNPQKQQPQASFNIIDTFSANNVGTLAPTNTNSTSIMRQVFKNNEITLYCSSVKSNDKLSTTNVTFYISNNVNKSLINVKLQFSVPKYMERTINSPSGNTLTAMASLGIQQNIQLNNSQLDKPIILKIRIIYNYDGKEITETIQIDDL